MSGEIKEVKEDISSQKWPRLFVRESKQEGPKEKKAITIQKKANDLADRIPVKSG